MAQHKIIQSNKTRWGVYVFAGIVFAAVIVATLIEIGILSDAQVESWMTRVGLLVAGGVGLAQSILAAKNVDKTEPVEPPTPAGPLGE